MERIECFLAKTDLSTSFSICLDNMIFFFLLSIDHLVDLSYFSYVLGHSSFPSLQVFSNLEMLTFCKQNDVVA